MSAFWGAFPARSSSRVAFSCSSASCERLRAGVDRVGRVGQLPVPGDDVAHRVLGLELRPDRRLGGGEVGLLHPRERDLGAEAAHQRLLERDPRLRLDRRVAVLDPAGLRRAAAPAARPAAAGLAAEVLGHVDLAHDVPDAELDLEVGAGRQVAPEAEHALDRVRAHEPERLDVHLPADRLGLVVRAHRHHPLLIGAGRAGLALGDRAIGLGADQIRRLPDRDLDQILELEQRDRVGLRTITVDVIDVIRVRGGPEQEAAEGAEDGGDQVAAASHEPWLEQSPCHA